LFYPIGKEGKWFGFTLFMPKAFAAGLPDRATDKGWRWEMNWRALFSQLKPDA
jgi:hypothetical protein